VAAIAAASLFIVVELATQHAVLAASNAQRLRDARGQTDAVQYLRQLGIRPPCVITSTRVAVHITLPAAYYLDCSYQWHITRLAPADGRRVVVLVRGDARPQPFARYWPAHRLPKTAGDVVAYVEPGGL